MRKNIDKSHFYEKGLISRIHKELFKLYKNIFKKPKFLKGKDAE